MIHDLSEAGIGLILDQALPTGTRLQLLLDSDAVARSWVLAEVVHATPDRTGTWLVGARFERPLSPTELEALLRQWQ
jgi:hypothetical protein